MSRNGSGWGDNVHRLSPRGRPPTREPAFNAPWPPVALAALLVAIHGLGQLTGFGEALAGGFGLIPAALSAHPWGLVTHMFVHGFWGHVLLNAVALLAFGAPVARWLGEGGAGGPLRFFGFYLLCGLLAALGYILLKPGSAEVLIGASGAVAGLMGASSRLLGHPGRLAPLRDRQVIALGVGWLVINILFALLGAMPGIGMAVAWEAHLIGYAAGLLLVGPFASLTRAR